jgi:hypothetical protein
VHCSLDPVDRAVCKGFVPEKMSILNGSEGLYPLDAHGRTLKTTIYPNRAYQDPQSPSSRTNGSYSRLKRVFTISAVRGHRNKNRIDVAVHLT